VQSSNTNSSSTLPKTFLSFSMAESEKSAANQGSENRDMTLDERFPFILLLLCVRGMGFEPDFGSLSCLRVFAVTLIGHTTIIRTPLDERSARGRDLYLTTHNTHKIQTYMPLVGFEHTIPASGWPKAHPLDRLATGIGCSCCYLNNNFTLDIYIYINIYIYIPTTAL
jgi:hypothetical protein